MARKKKETISERSSPSIGKRSEEENERAVKAKEGASSAVATMSAGVLEEFETLLRAIKAGELDTRADLRGASGTDRDLLEGINEMLDAVIGPFNVAAHCMHRLAKGQRLEKIEDGYKGDFDKLKEDVNQLIGVMNGFVDETGVLIDAAQNGKLDARADAGKLEGVWRKVLAGTNEVVDAIVAPLNVAAEYVDRISKGDIPEKITDEYKGDFNEVKNNLNVCIDAINGLVGEAAKLADAAAKGDVDTRGDADN
ncbi:MAG: hypothetical protein JRJ79_18255, partial [Deltaproteobacteria bacterium]|nr:hypothetical protein [Deltaproteobacteria bacterium]